MTNIQGKLHPAFVEVLKGFEVRDTELVNMMEKARDFPDLVAKLVEARQENLQYAQEELRGILPTNLTELDEQVAAYITGGVPNNFLDT